MGDIDNNEYGFPAHMWCGRKHLGLLEVHAYEMQSKIQRDCSSGECVWSNPTRKKADKIVNHLLAFEEHMADVVQKGGEDAYGTVAQLEDDARRIRQEIINTGIQFDASSGITPTGAAREVMQTIGKKVGELKKRIDQMASKMKQDQGGAAGYAMAAPAAEPEPQPVVVQRSSESVFAAEEGLECDTCKEDIGSFEAEIGRVDVNGSIFG
jgi:hypothetical protein